MRLTLLLLILLSSLSAQKVKWIVWFDTEDFILPASDDAALRLARELEKLNVRATFKVVAEKARVLEQRGRWDVIQALARHDIGYHSENHSVPPTPSVYLSRMGMLEGAAEFVRREGPGNREVERIFGRRSSTYGQPGNSWGPQSTIALRRMGIPTYVDEAGHIVMGNQPFWYGGILHVTNLGPNAIRAELKRPERLPAALAAFDAAVSKLKQQGGGIVQTIYHPTEFVTTEFWDAVNFKHGRYTAPESYQLPKQRTATEVEEAFRTFLGFVRHVLAHPDVEVTSVDRLPTLYVEETPKLRLPVWREGIQFEQGLTAAEILTQLLGLGPVYVDGPERRGVTTYREGQVERTLWQRAVADVRHFVESEKRLPAEVWLGAETLSLADFAMTLARDGGEGPARIERGTLLFERHIANDGRKEFNWVIHPPGFDGSALLELGRLQAWTLKPARLR